MLKRILAELEHHLPFTIFGALTGIVFMLVFSKISYSVSHTAFYVLHPIHVVLSALVTSSMYEKHKCPTTRSKCRIWTLLFIGYVGSIGIATVSDSIIPYIGEILLDMPHSHAHAGFIEKWWLINPLAVLGIAIAYFRPSTKFPHAGHVLISTWASVFHIIMAKGNGMGFWSYVVIFLFLFIAVWLPCCISDIVFPLLFVNDRKK